MLQPTLLPPTHLIDAPGVFISPLDPAWDHARCDAEIAALRTAGGDAGRAAYLARIGKPAPETEAEQMELAEAVEAGAREHATGHPLLRYLAGLSRFQLGAHDWTPEGKSCTAQDYLRPDATPCRFTLVRPGRKRLRAVEAVTDTWERREAWVRAVVRRIEGPEGTLAWSPASDADEVPEPIFEAIAAWSPALLRQVADACAAYCAPLREHEGKR